MEEKKMKDKRPGRIRAMRVSIEMLRSLGGRQYHYSYYCSCYLSVYYSLYRVGSFLRGRRRGAGMSTCAYRQASEKEQTHWSFLLIITITIFSLPMLSSHPLHPPSRILSSSVSPDPN